MSSLPPVDGGEHMLRHLRRPRSPGISARADFQEFDGNWAAAQAVSSGYSSPQILERVLTASLAVEAGGAAHERDSVNFDSIEYAWPVLAALLWSAVRAGGRLRVLDLGGSLGTTYRQNRRFLADIREVSWAIVEQPGFVQAGQKHFANDVLSFHASLRSAATTYPDVALAGSSLQYLEDPDTTLADLSETGISTLIIDRTPLHPGDAHRLVIQHVPERIYPASYPAWILSRATLSGHLDRLGWEVVEEFDGLGRRTVTSGGLAFDWAGMVCRRRVAVDVDG